MSAIARSAPDTAMAFRIKASALHLVASAAVAAGVAALVFTLWYPVPYREVSGGRELFVLVVAVDIVLGPLITLAVFDRRKSPRHLRRDLAVIVLLQLGALCYGLHTVAQARPAVVALEGDRLRVVRAIDLAQADFSKAPEGLHALSWWGPLTVATRAPTPEEKLSAMQRGLAGEDIGMRPEFWRPASEAPPAIAGAAHPIDRLMQLWPQRASMLREGAMAVGLPMDQIGYLPILARRTDWSALVDRKTGDIVGYVPIDGF